jgi:hypothetical protein
MPLPSSYRLLILMWLTITCSTSRCLGQETAYEKASNPAASDDAPPADGKWIQLFNGRDIDDWIVKINHHDVGDNFGDTFRVHDGILQVRYDQYGQFNDQFAHLYYKRPFSHYHIVVEYRFVGTLQPGAPDFSVMNSGVMLHSQDPRTMLRDQNWPIAIEFQLLAGLDDGKPRGTGNACTPGTNVYVGDRFTTDHVIHSTAKTYKPEEWVRAEAIVRGHGKMTHIINGEKVLEYSRPEIGGGVVTGYDPKVFIEGKPISEGYVALQSEGQPVDFRKVELKILDPTADESADDK